MKASSFFLFPVLVTLTATSLSAQVSTDAPDARPTLGIQQKQKIKVVFQITSADLKDGLNKDLQALKKTYEGYLRSGVPATEIHLHTVIHGNAADHLLTDEAWRRFGKGSEGNPNTALIEKLLSKGVKVELCDSRRVQNGWEKSDVHPGVTLVGNAYHRLADLQLQGYAYIRL